MAITSYSCFLSHVGAFWGAFLAPILVVMVFNMVIFIRIIVVLIQLTRNTAAQRKEPVSKQTIIHLMISISGVMFLFGLTWSFAILTFSVPGLRETGSILFTIFNSFQGFFIFLFTRVISKEARETWKEFLLCGRYKSQFLHPSHIKITSSGGMTATIKPNAMPRKHNTGTISSPEGMNSQINLKTFNYESCTLLKNKDFKLDLNKVPQFDSEASALEEASAKVSDLGTPTVSGSCS